MSEGKNNFLSANSVGVFAWIRGDIQGGMIYLGDINPQTVGDISQAQGTPEPVYAPSSTRRGESEVVGVQLGSPELGELTIVERLHPYGQLWIAEMKRRRCPIDLLLLWGKCGNPQNQLNWTLGQLYELDYLNNIEQGAAQTFDGSNPPIELTGTFSFADWHLKVVEVPLALVAGTTITTEAIDVMFADDVACEDCGDISDGCQKLFAICKGSALADAFLIYSVDGGTNFGTDLVDNLTQPNDPSGIIRAGEYVVVYSALDEGHFYLPLSAFSAAGVTGTWSNVTTGYVASSGPTDAFAFSPRNVLFSGLAGYVYQATDILSSVTPVSPGDLTTEDVNKISGAQQTAIAVCDNNVVLKSSNRGYVGTWVALTGPEVAANLTAVLVLDNNRWLIGTSTGKVWYTQDGGVSYTQKGLPTTVAEITDINFSPESANIIGITANTSDPEGVVFRSINGGRDFWDVSPLIAQLTTPAVGLNALAMCYLNTILVGGLGAASDGVLGFGNADKVLANV